MALDSLENPDNPRELRVLTWLSSYEACKTMMRGSNLRFHGNRVRPLLSLLHGFLVEIFFLFDYIDDMFVMGT